MSKKLKVAVLFGGRSPEHEVSIITGIQIMNALDKTKYEVLPIYISKTGKWIKGDASFFNPVTFKNLDKLSENKKMLVMSSDPSVNGVIEEPTGLSLDRSFKSENIDVIFPAFHGRYGEDGAIQGLFELSNIPYVGCDVQASAIGMDKVISKKIARSINIPTLDDCWLKVSEWKSDRSMSLKKLKSLKFPVFVKPARLGSSIGITKAKTIKEAEDALDVAFFYDTKVMVEESLEGASEVNISVLGNDPYEVSVCEMPVSSGEVLSFEDKYIAKDGSGSKGMATAQRLIPAPIKDSTRRMIEEYAKRFFAEIGGQGIARVDFLITKDEKQIFFNEINTLPGSIAFYLWKENDVDFAQLVDKMVNLGIERSEVKKSLITTFKSNILSGFSGTKGIKG